MTTRRIESGRLRSGPSPRPGRTERSWANAGFTLVEMLIALVATGILAGAVISLLMGQNRFYGSTDDAVFAEQSLRATSDLVASEVRMAVPSVDIIRARSDELTFWSDAERGVVCHRDDGTSQLWVFMLDSPSAANLKNGPENYAEREAYSASSWTMADPAWNPLSAGPTTAATDGSIDDTCESGGGPATDNYPPERYWRFDSWSGTLPPDGALLRIVGKVTYSFGPSSFGSGTAIFRNGQELAAPFESDAAFRYVMAGGGVQSSVSSSNFGSIDRIRLDATAVGSGNNRYDVTRNLQFDIPLKN